MPAPSKPFIVHCVINNVSVPFELDSGAQISTISYTDACKVNAAITNPSKQVRAYDGLPVKLLDETPLRGSSQNFGIFFILGPILLKFHTICKIEKETLFVHENFSI